MPGASARRRSCRNDAAVDGVETTTDQCASVMRGRAAATPLLRLFLVQCLLALALALAAGAEPRSGKFINFYEYSSKPQGLPDFVRGVTELG